VAPFARAVRDAEAELTAAFRMRQQYDEGIPEEPAARQHALAGIVGRCEEAGRRLDGEAAGLDQLRALERGVDEALEIAEARFRTLAARTGAVEALLTGLGRRYAPSATAPVTGHVEQAKDRLVLATLRLNQSRQAADRQEPDSAASHLRTAESAITQAATLLNGIERLASELTAAEALLPAALTGAVAGIAGARERLASLAETPDEAAEPEESAPAVTGGRTPDSVNVPSGELWARILHADGALAVVRDERTTGPYDPLGALRRIVRSAAPLTAEPTAGVLGAAALLVGRSAVAAAGDFLATHRGAVGAVARTRLAEAERLLAEDPVTADTYAQEARDLAERTSGCTAIPLPGRPSTRAGWPGRCSAECCSTARHRQASAARAPALAGRARIRCPRRSVRTGSATPPPDPPAPSPHPATAVRTTRSCHAAYAGNPTRR
jgi:hypothetical protein